MRITPQEMKAVLKEKLVKHGVPEDIADPSADNFVQNSLDGVYSHGVNRFPRVIRYLDSGWIKPEARPECVESYGAMEKWDGHLGMGNTNGKICMDRAIELAKQYGIGCVALRHTNHFMRGGTFGIQAARENCIGICWTNSQPNMPTWGAKDRRIGNNPLIFCVPRGENGYVLVDGAMSQYSYGVIEKAKLAGEQLPYPGGFDDEGNLTCDPATIETNWRVLPIGYWKGSGFSILLDMMVAGLSEGYSVTDVGKNCDEEYDVCQMFMAIDMSHSPTAGDIFERMIEDIKASERVNPEQEILIPSEKEQRIYEENAREGIPVNETVWQQILAL